jgi:hypothetical protein
MATTFSLVLRRVTKNGQYLCYLPFLSGEERFDRGMISGGGIENAN